MALEDDTKTLNDDNFSAAFDRLAELGETNAKADNDAMTAQHEEVEDEEVEDDGEEAEVQEDTVPEGDEGVAEPEPAPEPEPAAQESDEDLLNRLASLVKKAPAKEEPAQPAAAPAAEETPLFSAEEQEFLAEYERDWPDVARAEQLRRRAEYGELVGYVFNEIAKEFGPIMEAVQAMSTRAHLNDLQEVVSDYDDVRDKVIDWVGTQPAYLQPAYNHVIQNGTVDEVADLINRYKEATGVQIRSSGGSKKETELPTATKQAAASLAPVSSKRSAVLQADDPNDFESAFESFADKL